MPCVLRETVVRSLEGGYVQFASVVLSQFFKLEGTISGAQGSRSHRLGSAESIVVFAQVGVLLADEPALKDGHELIQRCLQC